MTRPREPWAIHAAGFFSLSFLQIFALTTSLWGGHIGLSAAMLGVAASARSVAPMVYSIHLGAMLDRLGAARMMAATALIGVVLPPLYPFLPGTGALVMMQVVLGLAAATAWLSAQACLGIVAGGDAGITARFSLASGAGTVAAPLLLGFVWDRIGPEGGFVVLSSWSLGLFLSSMLSLAGMPAPQRRPRLRDLVPIPADHVRALRLLLHPVCGFVMICTFLRLGAIAVQESFYPVLLNERGMGASTIGMLVALGNLASSPAALTAGFWINVNGSERRALATATFLSVAAIAVTPALDGIVAMAAAMIVFGFGIGVGMPLMFMLLSRGFEAGEQGLLAGTRGAANRFAAFVAPALTGIVAQIAGLGNAFWIFGLTFSACVVFAEFAYRKRL